MTLQSISNILKYTNIFLYFCWVRNGQEACTDISTSEKTVLQNLDEMYGLLVNPKKKKKKRQEMKRKMVTGSGNNKSSNKWKFGVFFAPLQPVTPPDFQPPI